MRALTRLRPAFGGLALAACLALVPVARPAAADLDLPLAGGPPAGASPRFFPRGDGVERRPRYGPPARPVPVGCIPRRAPVPTNAPGDPSYVGSEYGLSHPSYYGFAPPLGVDDPYGRPLRPYCP